MILPPAVQDVEQLLAQQWDFVVIGGGTAGLTLASLLSDNESVRVLVLERGVHRPDDLMIQAPVLWSSQLGNPEYDDGYMSVPQMATGKPIWFSAARTLGGTSTLNAMSFIPPPRNELQAWVELGNSEESSVGLLDELKAIESFKASADKAVAVHDATGKPELRGTNGPVPGRHSTLTPTILPQWYETLRALGFRTGVDPRETGVNIGGFMVQNAINDENERAHAANSYYAPRSNHDNLAVITEAQVNRVVLNAPASDTGLVSATGVEFTYQGRVWTVQASREIILSGGTFASPKILELSGIGNEHILAAAGVEVKVALDGVGENLHDHWAFNFNYRIDPSVDIVTLDELRDPSTLKTHTEQYNTSRTGLLAAGQSSVTYISASQLFTEEELASILAEMDEDVKAAPAGLREQYAATRRWLTNPEIPFIEVFPQYQYISGLAEAPGAHEKFFTVFNFVTHPCSRGSMHIISADPAVSAMLDPRFWSHPFDKQLSRAMYRFGTEQLAKTEPLASLFAGPGFPAADAPEAVVDEMLASGFSGHGIGTCSMLPRDKGGVVDDKLRVHGTKNLRIVDASTFPLHFSGHPQALVYALAHRATRLIANEHNIVAA